MSRSLLSDPHWDVRKEAALALGNYEHLALEPLLPILYDDDPEVQEGAAEAIAKIGPVAVEPLLKILETGDDYVRIGACLSLMTIPDSRIIPAILRILRDKQVDAELRSYAAQVLAQFNSEEPISTLTGIVESETENEEVRKGAVIALRNITDSNERIADTLFKALSDKSDGVRAAATWYLERFKAEGVTARLLAALNDPAVYVRRSAIGVLRELNTDEATRVLMEHLQVKTDLDTKIRIIEALGKAKSPPFLELLLQFLHNPQDTYLLHTTVEALARLSDPRAVEPILQKLLECPPEMLSSKKIAKALKSFEVMAVPRLIELLDTPNSEWRAVVVYALGEIGNKRASRALLNCVTDPDLWVSIGAIHALGKIGDKSVLPDMIKFEQAFPEDISCEVTQAIFDIRYSSKD
ncbi:MAG TPA: HEAT repeat domain-containing protein [Chloroflexia bacterium]|nr:HEAT repeat domain-containing protein [Chloroflexia bacterium]